MNLDEHIAQLVRETVMPLLVERLNHLEERLVARLNAVAPSLSAPTEPSLALLTRQQVALRLGVAPRTLHRLVVGGKFPRPLQISPNRIGWHEADVTAWLERRDGEP